MAVPISMLLGAPLPLVIIFTGVFVTCYSMAGGISAVVYTDVLQVCADSASCCRADCQLKGSTERSSCPGVCTACAACTHAN